VSLAVSVQSVLDGVATALATRIATALTDIATAGGPALAAPASTDITVRIDDSQPWRPAKRPEVRLTWEALDAIEVATATDIDRGAIVARIVSGGFGPVQSDHTARYYALAVRHALNRIAGQVVPGLVTCRVRLAPEIESLGEGDIHGRMSTIRAEALIVTTGARP
jgi:hypothetical protein